MNKNFVLLIIVMSLASLASAIFSVIFPLYLDYKNIPLPTIGLIFALPVFLSLMTRLMVGTVADIYGRKKFYSFALIGGSISNFLFTFANNVWHFLSINLFSEFSIAFSDAVDHIIIYETVKKKSSGKAFGKLRSATKLLAFVGTLVAGSILVILGYTGTFIFCSSIFIICFLIFLKFKERKIKSEHIKLIDVFDFRSLTRNLKIFTVSGTFFDAASAMTAAFSIQLFLTKIFGLSPVLLSIVLGITALVYALSSFFLGKLPDVFSPKKVFAIMYVLLAIDAVFIGLIHSAFFVSLLWIISGIFMAVADVTRRKMVNTYARAKHRGRDTNISRAISAVGVFSGSLIAAYVAVISFGYVFIIAGICCFLSALSMSFVRD